MATEHEPAEELYENIQMVGDYIFISIYVLETIAKLYSYGIISWYWKADSDDEEETRRILPKIPTFYSPYFGDVWNAFDFSVVVLSLVDMFSDADLPIFKLLRVLRVFRLVRRIKTLQVMMNPKP
jgi:hypothetical protein